MSRDLFIDWSSWIIWRDLVVPLVALLVVHCSSGDHTLGSHGGFHAVMRNVKNTTQTQVRFRLKSAAWSIPQSGGDSEESRCSFMLKPGSLLHTLTENPPTTPNTAAPGMTSCFLEETCLIQLPVNGDTAKGNDQEEFNINMMKQSGRSSPSLVSFLPSHFLFLFPCPVSSLVSSIAHLSIPFLLLISLPCFLSLPFIFSPFLVSSPLPSFFLPICFSVVFTSCLLSFLLSTPP